MSNYLRDILGAGSQTDRKSQPLPLIAADIPGVPDGTGANKGFWEIQLRDKEGNWAEMGGDFTFELELEGIGKISGHGKLMKVVRPGVGLLRVTNHPVLGDRDIEVASDDISSVEAIIPDADFERVTGKKLGPKGKASELKDEITGDEALKTIRSYVTSSLKKEGRFPVIRSDEDIEKVVSEQYKSFFDQIKKENPELLKVFNMEIPNADLFWDYIKSNFATDLMTRYMAPEDLPPLMKRVNQLYAEKFLGLKKDGLISFYRNNIRGKDTEADAAAGYASLDKYMAFDYNVDMGKREGGPNTGRYEIKAKPDEINGLLGFSRIGDEIGAVISPEVTAIPGRVTRLGDLEIPDVDSAPWLDLKNIEWDRSLGSSPFRQHRPLGQFDYYGLDKDPFGGGNTWASFYEAHGLEKGAIPGKYDELYGEGSWERDFKDLPPMASQFKAFFTEYTDVDGSTKWGLRGDALWNIGMGETDLSNPKANDGFEKNIKLLSTMQELMGTPFFVSRGHHQDDPRVPTKPVVSNNLSDLGVDFQTATMDADGTRLPTPGAFTGKFQDIVAGAKDWKEVQERLKGQTITYFDFETTGISDYDGDGIKNDPIQLGAVQVKDGQIVKRFNLYVNPGSKLSYWSATKLQRDVVDENGKRVVDEEGKPASTLVTPDWLEQQVSPEDAVRQFIEFIGPEALVGGQNVPFDLEILRRMANSAEVELDIAGTIDSKDLASLLPKYDPEKGIDGPKQVDKDTGNLRPSSSLGPVANFLGFEPANWHSADGDAEDSYNLVSKIIDRAANEDSKDLRLLDFPEMEKQYKKKMDEFKAVVSKDNPITERQKKALTEFADSKYPDIASVAKEALSVKQTRGQAAQLLEKINEVNDKRSAEDATPDVPFEEEVYDYRGQHESPNRSDDISASLDKIDEIFPTDVLDPKKQKRLYKSGYDKADDEAFEVINSINGNPDAIVTIYRGVPDGVDKINPGDWVTLSPTYAQEHVNSNVPGGKIISKQVKASEIFTDANSIQEWGYDPEPDPNRKVEEPEEVEAPELTEEEIEKLALGNYSVYLYSYINKYLKSGRESLVDSDPFTSNPANVDKIVEYAEAIKKAFNKDSNTLKEDKTLSRIVPRFVGENLKPGDIVEESSILSTTKNSKESGTKNMFDRSVIHKSSLGHKDLYGNAKSEEIGWTVYEIEAPEGTKAIDMEGIGEISEEGEVLLPPNTKLEVVSVEDRPEPDFPQKVGSTFKAYTVKLRVIPDSNETPTDAETKKPSLISSLDLTGSRLSDSAREELDSLISSFNTANNNATTEVYREIASELGRPVSLPWDRDRTPEGRDTYEYIYSAKKFSKPTPENDEEKELLRIKNLFEDKLKNNKELQEAKTTLYNNKLYKDLVDALNSKINDFDKDEIDYGLMDVGRSLSSPRPRLTEEEIEDFSLTYPDFGDQEVNDLVYDITIDLEDSVEITNKDLKDFAESGVVSVILPMSALKDVLAEGRMKTVHETKYSLAGNSSEEYRALRVAYESLAFGYGGDSPMEERPVYGLLRSAKHPMPEDALMIYGGRFPAQIVLKPEVKTRTTISDRDSLNHFEPTTPLTDPKFDASYITRMVGVYREATGENFFESENFAKYGSIEAQVHGGVKLDDIGKVLFYETPPEEILELLTSMGIIWEVSKQKPYSKPRSFGGGIF